MRESFSYDYYRQVFELSVCAGHILLESGAEIFRVEDTMVHIANALNMNTMRTYIVANGVFANAETPEHDLFSKTVYVPATHTHLGKLEAVNRLSRGLSDGTISLTDAQQMITEIDTMPSYPQWVIIAATALANIGFSQILGGTPTEIIPAALNGILLAVITAYLARFNSKVATNVIGAAVGALLVAAEYRLFPFLHLTPLISTTMISLVPGVLFTNAIRDFTSNNYLSGTVRMLDAIVISVCIAIGTGIFIHTIV